MAEHDTHAPHIERERVVLKLTLPNIIRLRRSTSPRETVRTAICPYVCCGWCNERDVEVHDCMLQNVRMAFNQRRQRKDYRCGAPGKVIHESVANLDVLPNIQYRRTAGGIGKYFTYTMNYAALMQKNERLECSVRR